MARRWSKTAGATIGFVAVALYVIVPEGTREGWPMAASYYLGTGIGAGLVGAVVGWFVCALQNRRVDGRTKL